MSDLVTMGRRRFTVDEYDRMAETGILSPGERVELVHGVVRSMSPKNRAHVITTHVIHDRLREALRGRASVYVEAPLRLEALDSVPEPDVVVCSNPDLRAYASEQTTTLLVIEVADSSVEYDLGAKALLYAKAAVPEYWVVDLVDRRLVVFTEPREGSYRHRSEFTQDARVTPVSFPDLEIDTASLFP